MVLYPDVMRQAQAQIDQVVGRSRLPSFSDRDRLPYIDALVKEVHRWKTVGPLGLPRYTSQVRHLVRGLVDRNSITRLCLQDDYYKGYFIPKGKTPAPLVVLHSTDASLDTLVILNVWSVLPATA